MGSAAAQFSTFEPLRAMSNTFTVEKGFAGNFKQASGTSRPGVDWAIRITGAQDGVVVVRTYF
jgi:hypothetical protein